LVTTGLVIVCIVGLLSFLHFIHKAFNSAIKFFVLTHASGGASY
jgi:hypothetical protein